MKKIKKIISKLTVISLASILAFSSFSTIFAQDSEEDIKKLGPLFFNYGLNEETGDFEDKSEQIKTDNYWSDLKYVKVSAKHAGHKSGEEGYERSFKMLIPKYIKGPDETALHKYSQVASPDAYNDGLEFNNIGIRKDAKGLEPALDFFNGEYEYINHYWDLNYSHTKNPFNFTANDLLTREDCSNRFANLKILGDLQKKGSKDSKKVDELKAKEDLNLEFLLNASWFKKYYNGNAILLVSPSGIKDEEAKKSYENRYAMSDSEIVFNLDIPDEVKIDESKLKANIEDSQKGIKDLFDITTEVKTENINGKNKKVLLVKLNKKEKAQQNTKWSELLKKINDLDTSNIKISISGLSIAEDAKTNEKITIKAGIGGFYDFALSNSKEFYLPSSEHNQTTAEHGTGGMYSERFYWSFAAVQDPAGLDEAAPKDKPNLISYTFKVKAGEVTPTPTPEPEPTPIPEPEVIEPKVHEYVETYPVYASVDKKEVVNSHEKYIFGYPDDTIRPDGDMTRAEAIAVVARLQKLDLSDKSSKIYKDAKADMWYNGAINAAYREGYLLEKEGESIRPNDKITRAELAELISHIDKKNNTVAPFEDVKGHKFEAAINQAYGNERIKGYPDGTFKPDNTITRAEVATMLNKLYDRYPDKNFIDAKQNLVHNYKDMSYKGHWGYYELVEAYHSHTYLRLSDNMEEWKEIIK
ncbi:MAG: S-layer homology domain-containing protein [Peptoniphilus harei]|nr:S-layer homology domain-containing protein [Peptoniphilus harei]